MFCFIDTSCGRDTQGDRTLQPGPTMSEPFESKSVSRRDFLVSGAALAVGLAHAPATIWAAVAEAGDAAIPNRDLLEALCDAVIPDTDTPGAVKAGVPAFVVMAAAHGVKEAPADLLPRFFAALDAAAGGRYLALAPERRLALLGDIDTRAFARGNDTPLPEDLALWKYLKALIVVGYYTSKIGGSQELRFANIPFRFDPDVPYERGDRAYSSDWVAVRFG